MPTFFHLVVPTKNRIGTLQATLHCLLRQTYPHYQIVVSDNCSQDGTGAMVADLQAQGAPIRYLRTPERLSMASNYEFALSHLEGGYALFIGDDDGLIPGALDLLAALIERHRPQALIGKRCIYYWGNYPDPLLTNLFIEPRSSDYCYWLDTEPLLRLAADWLYIFNFATLNGILLPSVYHGGCISVDLLQRLRTQDGGRFFNCQFPDYYSAVRISAGVERYMMVETPYFIAGSSGNSTGVSAFMNQTDAKSEFGQFQRDNDIDLEPPLVFCHSFALFAAEALLKARKYSNRVTLPVWEVLFDKILDDARHKPTQAQYQDVVEKLQIIAAAIQKEGYVRQRIATLPYREPRRSRPAEGLDNGLFRNYTYYTDKQGIEDIDQAGLWAAQLSKDRKPRFISKPQSYFWRWNWKRRLWSLWRKLFGA